MPAIEPKGRKRSPKAVYPVNNANEKPVKVTVAKLAKNGAFKESPLENSTVGSNSSTNEGGIRKRDGVPRARDFSLQKSSTLLPKSQRAAVPDELKKRKKFLNECLTQTVEIVEDVGRKKWQVEFNLKEISTNFGDPFAEKRITNGATVMCVRKPAVKLGSFDAMKRLSTHEKRYFMQEMPCQKDSILNGAGGTQENACSVNGMFCTEDPQLRLQPWAISEALCPSDSMDGVAAASRKRSSNSSSGDESFSSLSLPESSSFSCKSETSSAATGELPPFNVVPEFVRSTHVVRDCKVVGNGPQSVSALPVQVGNIYDAKQKLDMECHMPRKDKLLPLLGNSLEFKFLQGRKFNKLGPEKGATVSISVEESQLSRRHCLSHTDRQNGTPLGVEAEIGNVLQYLSDLPLQERNTCDVRQKLDMEYHLPSQGKQVPLLGDKLKLKSLKGRLVEKLAPERGSTAAMSAEEGSLSSSCGLDHKDRKNATSIGVEVEIGSTLLPGGYGHGLASDDECSVGLTSLAFYSATGCSPDRFSEVSQCADGAHKWEFSVSNEDATILDVQSNDADDNWNVKFLDAMPSVGDDAATAIDIVSTASMDLLDASRIFNNDLESQMRLHEFETREGRMILQAKAKPWTRTTSKSFEQVSPDSLFGGTNLSRNSINCTLNKVDVHASRIDNFIDSQLLEDEDRRSLPSNACSRRNFSAREVTRNWQDGLALDAELLPNHNFSSNPNTFTSSPMYQSPIGRAEIACPLSPSDVRVKVDCAKHTGVETSNLKEAAVLQLDWRIKNRSAMDSRSSAVRALMSAFTISSSDSLPQKGPAVQEDSVADIPKLNERHSINHVNLNGSLCGSRELGQATAGNSSQQERMLYGLPLQPNGKASIENSLRMGERPAISINHVNLNGSLCGSRELGQATACNSSLQERILYGLPLQPSGKAGVLNPGKHSVPALKKQLPTSTEAASAFNRLRGDLECSKQDGFVTYTLLLDNSEDLLIARACKPGYSTGKVGYNLVYTFYAVRIKSKARWRTWGRKEMPARVLVGKMRVLRAVQPEDMSSGETKRSVELQFVLFDGMAAQVVARYESLRFSSLESNAHHLSSLSNAIPSLGSRKGSVASIPSNTLHSKCPSEKMIQEGTEIENLCCQLQANNLVKTKLENIPPLSQAIWTDLDVTNADIEFLHMCPPIVELAAIVITVPPLEEHRKASSKRTVIDQTPGWGLKFLKKSLEATHQEGECIQTIINNGPDYLDEKREVVQLMSKEGCTAENSPPVSQRFVEGHDGKPIDSGGTETNNKGEQDQQTKMQVQANVTVVLPAGSHTLPTMESSGPSPLIERWRSGGICDCGGWDLGCGLTILSTDRPSVYNTAEALESTKRNPVRTLSPDNPIQFFLQGSMQDAVVLNLSAVQDGLFVLDFQTQLTPLQAFAIAVAILHGKEPLPFEGMG